MDKQEVITMLFAFKIIFLVVFFIGVIIMFVAPFFYGKKSEKQNESLSRKITKTRLIGLIIGAVGLLVVLILAYFN